MRVVGSWTEAHRHVPGDINTGKRIKTGYPIPQVPKNPARTITKLLFSIKEGRKKNKTKPLVIVNKEDGRKEVSMKGSVRGEQLSTHCRP